MIFVVEKLQRRTLVKLFRHGLNKFFFGAPDSNTSFKLSIFFVILCQLGYAASFTAKHKERNHKVSFGLVAHMRSRQLVMSVLREGVRWVSGWLLPPPPPQPTNGKSKTPSASRAVRACSLEARTHSASLTSPSTYSPQVTSKFPYPLHHLLISSDMLALVLFMNRLICKTIK